MATMSQPQAVQPTGREMPTMAQPPQTVQPKGSETATMTQPPQTVHTEGGPTANSFDSNSKILFSGYVIGFYAYS